MGKLIRVGFLACLVQYVGLSNAREWTSSDGKSRVEAKLLTVEAGLAVLKREDDVVIRVALDRLSPADIEYLQQVTRAVEATVGGEPARSPGETSARNSLADATRQQTPPLADPKLARWQVVPDPTSATYDLKPDASLEIRIGGGVLPPIVLYPAGPSPFVALAKDEAERRLEIWDLRKGAVIRTLVGQFSRAEQMALSSDGVYLASESLASRGTIQIWSIADGNVVRTIEVPESHSHIDFRAFVGSKRIIVGDSSEVDYLIFDLPSGDLSGKIDFGSGYSERKCTLSPGGSYLAAFSSQRRQLALYDTRNGACAGRIDVDDKVPSRVECLAFSSDGKELASWFARGIVRRLLVWDMTSGKLIASHEFKPELGDDLWMKRYSGAPLEWIPGGQGWLLNGLAMIDRGSGKIVWRDAEQLKNYDKVLPQRFVDAERMLRIQMEEGNGLVLRLVPRPDSEAATSKVAAEEKPASDDDTAVKVPEAQEKMEPGSAPQAGQVQVEVEPGAPPLAREGVAGWQAVPDPAKPGFDLKPDATVEIRISRDISGPFFLIPTAPSPFVVLGVEQFDGERGVWDLRTGEKAGSIEGEIQGFRNKDIAVSPDGRYLAQHGVDTDHFLQIWSFSAGKLLHEIKLPEQLTGTFLDFAGPKRLVLGSLSGDYWLFDVSTGQKYGRIESRISTLSRSAISPGGTYLVARPEDTEKYGLYDTRNGVCAGWIGDTDSLNPECFVFSGDGKELASWSDIGGETVLSVWDMTSGNLVTQHRRRKDMSDDLYRSGYRGRKLEWMPSGSGWLIYGSAIVDRQLGDVIWRDEEAIQESLDLLPRRVVDGDRLLVCRTERKAHVLRLEPLPIEEMTAARQTLAARKNPADADPPPVVEADRESMVARTFTDADWKYVSHTNAIPDVGAIGKPFTLGEGFFANDGFFFSDAKAARVAVARLEEEPEASKKATDFLTEACQLHDLRTGNKVAEFKPSFPAALIDLSPDGKFGVFWHLPKKERLDIWDLEAGEHVLGFRPFEGKETYDRQVKWARFADQDHLVTRSMRGNIVGWELSGCRATYSYPRPEQAGLRLGSEEVSLTPDRKTLVVVALGKPYLVDAVSGEPVGTLPGVRGYENLGVTSAGISPDGRRLAILDTCPEDGTLLIVWDLAEGTKLAQFELPYTCYQLVWCGYNHLLLRSYDLKEDFYPIVDVNRGLVVWGLRVEGGENLWQTPDGQLWCLRKTTAKTSPEFGALRWPDDRTSSILAKADIPEPLFSAGKNVALRTLIEKSPEAIPPGWPELENLDETLRDRFSQHLKEKQVNVDPASDVRLVVGIEHEGSEEEATIRNPYSGRSATLLLSSLHLTPYVQILDGKGKRIWERRGKIDNKKLNLEDRPPNIDAVTYLKLRRWEAALRWLQSVDVPCPVYHPNAHRGFGTATIGKKGR